LHRLVLSLNGVSVTLLAKQVMHWADKFGTWLQDEAKHFKYFQKDVWGLKKCYDNHPKEAENPVRSLPSSDAPKCTPALRPRSLHKKTCVIGPELTLLQFVIAAGAHQHAIIENAVFLVLKLGVLCRHMACASTQISRRAAGHCQAFGQNQTLSTRMRWQTAVQSHASLQNLIKPLHQAS